MQKYVKIVKIYWKYVVNVVQWRQLKKGTARAGRVNSMRYKYAIYFTWNDGFEDSFNVCDAKERDMNIKEMIDRKDFKSIRYCRIYANGEYGIDKVVL